MEATKAKREKYIKQTFTSFYFLPPLERTVNCTSVPETKL